MFIKLSKIRRRNKSFKYKGFHIYSMGKRQSFFAVFALLLFAFMPFAQALVSMSQPKEIYNLGDTLVATMNINEPTSFIGTSELTLKCDNPESVNIPVAYARVNESSFSVNYLYLVKDLVYPNNLLGSCFIEAVIEDSKGIVLHKDSTERFLITDKINITFNLDKEYFLPGEQMKFSGKAIKLNNEIADGIATVDLLKENTVVVEKGSFSGSIDLERNIKSGKHDIVISVKDDDENNGEITKEIRIIPIQTELGIGINNRSFFPDEKIKIKAYLLDQANDKIYDDVTFFIYSPDGKEAFTQLSLADREVEYKLPKTAMYGNWKIKAKTKALEAFETVYVQKYTSADVEITNGILYVTNTGNVPYSKEMEITFEQDGKTVTRIENISLNVGEKISYVLNAPDGSYNIGVETADAREVFENIPLTGKVIDINELSKVKREQLIGDITFIGILLFIAVVLAVVANFIRYKEDNAIKRETAVIHQHMERLKNRKSLKK